MVGCPAEPAAPVPPDTDSKLLPKPNLIWTFSILERFDD